MRRNKQTLPMKSMKLKVGGVCYLLYIQSDQHEAKFWEESSVLFSYCPDCEAVQGKTQQ